MVVVVVVVAVVVVVVVVGSTDIFGEERFGRRRSPSCHRPIGME